MFRVLIYALLTSVFISTNQAANDDLSKSEVTKCEFKITANSLTCTSLLGTETCDAKLQGVAQDFTSFAIGELKATSGLNPLVWFRLHPRKKDNSGWLFYRNLNNVNTRLSIHSKAKSSDEDDGLIVLDELCWRNMHMIIRSTKTFETIKAERYNPDLKTLILKPYQKVKVIGTLIIN